MRHTAIASLVAIALTIGATGASFAQEKIPGDSVESLLEYARQNNPEYASMRLEADAAGERVVPAGALPDPKFQAEWRDITKMGEQGATLAPNRVGSMRYVFMQDVPWFGKRDLKREIAELEAEGARGRAMGTWAELAARIKSTYAQLYYIHRNQRLSQEILGLMSQLEKVSNARYASGLIPQQDVIRAQVEQTNIRSELVMLENERAGAESRLNMLLARPANAPLAEPAKLRPLPQPVKLDYATLAERVRARNPQLFAENARIRAAEKSRELAYKNRFPDFTFGIAPIQNGSSFNDAEVMVGINIPLQQSARRSQERESEAMLSAARARREATANSVLADLSASLAGLEAARRVENLNANSLLPQADLTFQSALAAYENGKVDFATLMDAQRQIRMAKQNQIKAQAEAQARLAEIERLLGEDL